MFVGQGRITKVLMFFCVVLLSSCKGGSSSNLFPTPTQYPVILNPVGIVVSPSGINAYIANSIDKINEKTPIGSVAMFNLNTLVPLPVPAVSTLPYSKGLVISPDGKNLYVYSQDPSEIQAYSVDTSSGSLSSIENITTQNSNPEMMAINNSNTYAYLVSKNSVEIYKMSQGILTFDSQVSITKGFPIGITLSNDGTYAYVILDKASSGGDYLVRYNVEVNGLLDSESDVSLDFSPFGVATDPADDYLYLNSNESIVVFDTESGVLKYLSSTPQVSLFGGPLVINKSGTYAYFVDNKDQLINTYSIESGILAQHNLPIPIQYGYANGEANNNYASTLALSPAGDAAYVVSDSDSGFGVYNIESGTISPVSDTIYYYNGN